MLWAHGMGEHSITNDIAATLPHRVKEGEWLRPDKD